MTVEDLPPVNATLNAIATVLIITGLIFIRRENKRMHIACMVSALVVSTAFLVCYTIYHRHAGHTTFTHGGLIKTIYLLILFTHIPLAALTVPLVLLTVIPAIRRRIDKHKRIARWTFPIWLYVSVTGVIIYFMLYHWFPPS